MGDLLKMIGSAQTGGGEKDSMSDTAAAVCLVGSWSRELRFWLELLSQSEKHFKVFEFLQYYIQVCYGHLNFPKFG